MNKITLLLIAFCIVIMTGCFETCDIVGSGSNWKDWTLEPPRD